MKQPTQTSPAKKPRSKAQRATAPELPPPAQDSVQVSTEDVLGLFHPITAGWFRAVFEGVTAPQREGWPSISRGESTLILAPTGTGKTLAAFLWCLDKLMLRDPAASPGCRVLYISPLKAFAVDVERNLRSPSPASPLPLTKHIGPSDRVEPRDSTAVANASRCGLPRDGACREFTRRLLRNL